MVEAGARANGAAEWMSRVRVTMAPVAVLVVVSALTAATL